MFDVDLNFNLLYDSYCNNAKFDCKIIDENGSVIMSSAFSNLWLLLGFPVLSTKFVMYVFFNKTDISKYSHS